MATKTREISDFLVEGGADLAIVGEPHITPGTLYPAYKGLLTDNTGAHTITDSSASGRVISSVGDVNHSGLQKKIGSTALQFGGSSDYLTVPDHADWVVAGNNWTIEFFVYMNATSIGSGNASFFQQRSSSGSGSDWQWRIYMDSATQFSLSGSVSNTSANFAWTPATKTWYHVALVRDSNNAKLFINGTQTGGNQTVSANFPDVGDVLMIGRIDTANFLDGYMDDIRITTGMAVYTGNFTAPTSALTTTWSAATGIAANSTASNVKLLIHSDAGGHSGAFGTAQSDGLKYYYTDIKGSKPIKDPRIGAHFGSQRHRCSSLQLLEQETATHGTDVYSMDGRKWARCVGNDWTVRHDKNAIGAPYLANVSNANNYIEVTGYFSHANMSSFTNHDFPNNIDVLIDGTDTGTQLSFETSAQTPLYNRFVDATSLKEVPVGSTTLGIHTLRLTIADPSAFYFFFCKFELIAQDTTSTATKSQIQIPSQNVVSYGKKFTVSGTPHYDPFNGFTNSSSLHSAFVDTATSLGLSSAPGSSAKWAISSTNNIRPYNGGRVVIWVDSSGTIKTSVNMMPPNAQNVGPTASNEITTPSATNTTTTPNLSDDAVDHSQAEVAKTFNWREFGNGAANTGTGGDPADVSMLHTSFDDVAYVMDDGLTSFSANDIKNNGENPDVDGTGGYAFITFIGTGFTIGGIGGAEHIVQNLPYGTHILKFGNADIFCDGIEVHTNLEIIDNSNKATEYTFYQPKKPPIPEDAVVLADYMLMADFVKQTDAEYGQISKGVRHVSGSRDIFYNASSFGGTVYVPANITSHYGLNGCQTGAVTTANLPSFCTSAILWAESTHASGFAVTLGGVSQTLTALDNSADDDNDAISMGTVTLGNNLIAGTLPTGGHKFFGYDVATPIHTSSHYQSFETPFSTELVGGDRNMEQTNLVVTADGKSWDEVTRDTSYISNVVFIGTPDPGTGQSAANGYDWIIDNMRGKSGTGTAAANNQHNFNKDSFTIAYNRIICLKEGHYRIEATAYNSSNSGKSCRILINDAEFSEMVYPYGDNKVYNFGNAWLERGDFINIRGRIYTSSSYPSYAIVSITKL